MSPVAKKSAHKKTAKKAPAATCGCESMAAKAKPKAKSMGRCGTRRCG